MPAIITHYTFALETMERKGRSPEEKEALLLGAQGPDPFFFFGQRPWLRRHSREDVTSFGHELHHVDPTDCYFLMMDEARKEEDEKARGILFSYLEGLLLHYSLDRNCHPYVWSRCGYGRTPEEKKDWGASHTWLETLIDRVYGGEKGTFTIHADKYLALGYRSAVLIGTLWAKANEATLRKESFDENSFLLSVVDYRAIMRLTNVPHGWSRFLTSLMGKKSVPYRMNLPIRLKPEEEALDVMNERHAMWRDPVQGHHRSESLHELMGKAKEDYKVALQILQHAFEGAEGAKEELRRFCHGLDHDGYRPSEKLLYMSPVWPGSRERAPKDERKAG